MLKEQVALRKKITDILNNPKNYVNEPFKMGDITCDDYHIDRIKVTDQILKLFKAEVDKLTVIDDEEIKEKLGGSWAKAKEMPIGLVVGIATKAQLQHTKKQLLGATQ